MTTPKPTILTLLSIFTLLSAAELSAVEQSRPAAIPQRRIRPTRPTTAKPIRKDLKKIALTKLTPTYILTGHALKLYRSPDSGSTWTSYDYGSNVHVRAMIGVTPSFFVGVGMDGKCIVTKNAGTTWTITNFAADTDFLDMAYIPLDSAKPNQTPRFIAVGYSGDNGRIFISPDGDSWQRTGNFNGGKLMTTAADSKGHVVAIGDYGFLYSHDYGQTWKKASWKFGHIPLTETIGNVYDVAHDPVNNRFAFVCFGDRTNVRSFNFRTSINGSYWEPGTEHLNSLSAYARGVVENNKNIATRQLATNGKGRIITTPDSVGSYCSDDGGRTWKLFYHNMPTGLTRIMDIAWDGQRFVGVSYATTTDGGKYLCYSDDGQNWTKQPLAKENSRLAINIAIGTRE